MLKYTLLSVTCSSPKIQPSCSVRSFPKRIHGETLRFHFSAQVKGALFGYNTLSCFQPRCTSSIIYTLYADNTENSYTFYNVKAIRH